MFSRLSNYLRQQLNIPPTISCLPRASITTLPLEILNDLQDFLEVTDQHALRLTAKHFGYRLAPLEIPVSKPLKPFNGLTLNILTRYQQLTTLQISNIQAFQDLTLNLLYRQVPPLALKTLEITDDIRYKPPTDYLVRYKNYFPLLAQKIKNLTKIKMHICADTKKINSFLEHYQKLQELDLSQCFNVDFDTLYLASSLTSFSANETNISLSAILRLLRKTPYLTSLHLSSPKQLKFDDLELADPEVQAALGKLKVLNLQNSWLTTQNLYKFLKHLKNLEHLNLNGCLPLDFATLNLKDVAMQQALAKLTTLDISNTNMSSWSLGLLIHYTPRLKVLRISNCRKINLAELLYFLAHNPQILPPIETLDLGNTQIPPQYLVELLNYFPELRNLYLENAKFYLNLLSKETSRSIHVFI